MIFFEVPEGDPLGRQGVESLKKERRPPPPPTTPLNPLLVLLDR